MEWKPRLAIVFMVMCIAGEINAQEVCRGPATLTYPLTEVLRTEAIELYADTFLQLEFNEIGGFLDSLGDAKAAAAYRQTVVDSLSGVGEIERDVRLLALLDYETQGQISLFSPSMTRAAGVFDLWLDVLDRRDMKGQLDRDAGASARLWCMGERPKSAVSPLVGWTRGNH